jgi:hypothetical protein
MLNVNVKHSNRVFAFIACQRIIVFYEQLICFSICVDRAILAGLLYTVLTYMVAK